MAGSQKGLPINPIFEESKHRKYESVTWPYLSKNLHTIATPASCLPFAAAPCCLASPVDRAEQASKPQPAVPRPQAAAVPESASHFLLGGQPLLAPAPHLLEGLMEGLAGPAAAVQKASAAAAQPALKVRLPTSAISKCRVCSTTLKFGRVLYDMVDGSTALDTVSHTVQGS
jgi:hypothetical protein